MKSASLWIILFAGLNMLIFSACNKKTTEADIETINVGALLSLTGNWSTLGQTSQSALEIAVEDINKYMEGIGSHHRFAVEVYDTKMEAPLALEYIQAAGEKGIRFVIGPQSSSEVAAIKPYADAHDMFVISQGSTAGSLSLPDDNIFRFCPDDKLEGKALAKTIYDSGVRGLVTAGLDDVGNTGLVNGISTAFTDLGGTVYAVSPYASGTSDFASDITAIEDKLNMAIGQYGASATAVYIAAFDEGADLFAQAKDNTLLNSVHWYGGDGITKSNAFINNMDAAEFAGATDFFAPEFGLPEEVASKWSPLIEEIKSRTGIEAGAFALACYDALWTIANTYEATEVSNHDVDSVRSAFTQEAAKYSGVTGSTQLNENGDRAAAIFDYWGIVNENGTYSWKLVGSSD